MHWQTCQKTSGIWGKVHSHTHTRTHTHSHILSFIRRIWRIPIFCIFKCAHSHAYMNTYMSVYACMLVWFCPFCLSVCLSLPMSREMPDTMSFFNIFIYLFIYFFCLTSHPFFACNEFLWHVTDENVCKPHNSKTSRGKVEFLLLLYVKEDGEGDEGKQGEKEKASK